MKRGCPVDPRTHGPRFKKKGQSYEDLGITKIKAGKSNCEHKQGCQESPSKANQEGTRE